MFHLYSYLALWYWPWFGVPRPPTPENSCRRMSLLVLKYVRTVTTQQGVWRWASAHSARALCPACNVTLGESLVYLGLGFCLLQTEIIIIIAQDCCEIENVWPHLCLSAGVL